MKISSSKIRTLRTERGWTQQHLADACDVSMRTIQRAEKDGAVSPETLLALCAVLEVESRDLVWLERPDPADMRPFSPRQYYKRMALAGTTGLISGILLTITIVG